MFDVHPPEFKVGDILHDEMAGDVEVVGEANGWPVYQEQPKRGPHRGLLPVLCGDLVRAVCDEPVNDVAEHWDVSTNLVKQWRRAIAGPDGGIEVGIALKRADRKFRKKYWSA